ncbi:DNA repair protein RecN [Flavihumibacter profundi]|uniref:DNA repair protein RecN n=1 Tax=Flavihumibacter profundi TaxID=2716883 RepID=UPI001CC5EC45|nr:DNA repair protein RecN [Flavihumibacter profundi]MBZ5859245.1 DNA repair protein RecN [Flavihumibacter profundi]
MLKELHIQNYAIIDELVIRFDGSLNIITGETGAGKSILMGALSLILGDRADINVVLNKEKKCFVEGLFQTNNKSSVVRFLTENDLEVSDELLIRREISVTGKSRAFVNDTPVTLNQLQQLSQQLVDLHRQFDTLSLGETGFQLSVIDAMAGNDSALIKYRKAFRNWQELQKQLTILIDRKNQENREFDYHQFLFNELDEAALKSNELEDIDAELKLLSNAEGIKAALANVFEQLKGQEVPVLQVIRQLIHQLQQYSQQHTKVAEIRDRMQAAYVELNDIAGEASALGDQIGHDTGRIEQLNERLNTGYKLLKKHNVQTTQQLLQIMEDLSGKLEAVEQLDETIARLEKETAAASKIVLELSQMLSAARKKQLAPFEKQVNILLARVGMPNARLKVQIEDAVPGINGADAIDFLFDANKSNQYAPIRKVASGGELSRLMLCIKSLVAGKMDLPTLIFDEIDSGISGEASRQVGLIMKELAAARQVICITHQPQIAGKADLHLFVYKEARGKSISTNIRVLDQEERIVAIAQMLSGEKPTPAALENAREMVMN